MELHPNRLGVPTDHKKTTKQKTKDRIFRNLHPPFYPHRSCKSSGLSSTHRSVDPVTLDKTLVVRSWPVVSYRWLKLTTEFRRRQVIDILGVRPQKTLYFSFNSYFSNNVQNKHNIESNSVSLETPQNGREGITRTLTYNFLFCFSINRISNLVTCFVSHTPPRQLRKHEVPSTTIRKIYVYVRVSFVVFVL